MSIRGYDKISSGFGKGTAAILELYFRFQYRPIYSHRKSLCISLSNFVVNKSDDRRRSYDVISIFQDGGVGNLLSVRLYWWHSFGKVEIYSHTEFPGLLILKYCQYCN